MSVPTDSELAGHAYGSDHLWGVLEDLAGVGSRLTGSEGERAGIELLQGVLAAVSDRPVHLEEFRIDGWQPRGATIRAGDAESAGHQVLPLPGSPTADVEREFVDLGHGRPADFERAAVEDAIVMVSSHTPADADRKLHRLDKYVSALEAGANGFVYGNVAPGCLPLTGEVGWHDTRAAIPAVGVSAEVRDRLARQCRDGPTRGRIQTDCLHEQATSRNVHTVVGPDGGDEVLLTAHVDTYDVSEGARDNGVGCAIVAEVGRLLSRVEGLENPVRLVVFGAEERGMHGAYEWAASHDLDDVKCVVNVDGAGDTRDLRLMTNRFEGMIGPFERVTDRLDVPLRVERTMNTTTDGWPFAERGIPAVTVGSDRSGSGRGWGHTHADTLDKLDPRVLRDLAITFAAVTLACASDDWAIDRVDPESVRDELAPELVTRMRRLGQI